MDTSADSLDANDRANELYWASDRSVNQIAEDLDLSKGALYGMIRPLPAARACPACSAEVVHPNRTAHERGMVECGSCGWSGPEDDAAAFESPSTNGSAVTDGAPPTAPSDALAFLGGHGRAVAGGAMLGAAVGLALVLWARRK